MLFGSAIYPACDEVLTADVEAHQVSCMQVLLITNTAYMSDIAVAHARSGTFHGLRFLRKTSREIQWCLVPGGNDSRSSRFPRESFPWWPAPVRKIL